MPQGDYVRSHHRMMQVTPPPAATARKIDSFVEEPTAKTNTVLVVDDNAANAELVSEILEMHGFCVRSTGTAEAAITMARAWRPALILMDINLPGMNGIAAAKILKNDPATRHIVVVGLTGEIHPDTTPHFAGYVTKPFQIQALVGRIQSFLSRT
jgi:two-component system cell cycle response regulator DivK